MIHHRRDFPLRFATPHIPEETGSPGHQPGTLLAEGVWRRERAESSQRRCQLPSVADASVVRAAAWLDRAWSRLLASYAEHPVLREILKGLADAEPGIRFLADGAALLAVDPDSGALELPIAAMATLDTIAPLSDRDHAADKLRSGLDLLLGLGLVHAGLSRRERSAHAALGGVLELYQAFSDSDRDCVFRALEGSGLDPDGLFSSFLQRADGGAATPDRERLIAWLLSRDRIGLPYDRRAALSILSGSADADEKRRRLHGVIRQYDRHLELANIERMAAELRHSGELLIFGRMSRAFLNQALLFADAVWLRPDAAWARLVLEFQGIALGGVAVQTAAQALRLLLESSAEAPLTRLEGAIERFEDAVLEDQRSALARKLKPVRERMEHASGGHAGPAPILDMEAVFQHTRDCLGFAQRLRQRLLESPRRPAAYVVVSQRPSATGSHLLAKLNELEDPYPGKPENLRKLLGLAGDRVYASPDYRWLSVADHWIEAIPLFIKEEVTLADGCETVRTVIDIAGMEESFREEMADHWAVNLRRVLESECLALAYELLSSQVLAGLPVGSGPRVPDPDREDVAALGLLFAEAYRLHAADVQRLVERESLSPFEAAREVLPDTQLISLGLERRAAAGSWPAAVAALWAEQGWTGDFVEAWTRLLPEALMPRRPLPALHVLTTQSAGMTEGYIRSWLEESVALFNIVEDHALHPAVASRRHWHDTRVRALGEKLIHELGLWVEVEELRAVENLAVTTAIDRLIAGNPFLREALSCLGVLLELQGQGPEQESAECVDEPVLVRAILDREAHGLRETALGQVLERNGAALRYEVKTCRQRHPELDKEAALRRVVMEDAFYRRDLETYTRLAARRLALERLEAGASGGALTARCRAFLRDRRQLSLTTARKEIIAERGLSPLALHPRYRMTATGPGKRFHLLYTPSRVDLGARERESVESWAQWVGGADRAATRVGRELYGLINKHVRGFDSLAEPEVLKTGENASMTSHFAFSNALSLMVAATRRGDVEAMAHEMNRRQDRRIHPAGEGYGGYCVPKDGLFLEFVLSLGRAEKLQQIGVPAAVQAQAIRLARELLERRSDFASDLDWESWAAERLRQAEWSPGAGLFQITRVARVLDGLGQPELRDTGRLAASLAARWGLHKMVTGGEQVNRFMPFFKVWLIRQALAEAARRHSPVDLARAIVVLTAEYKPDTQDGRFSVGLRKFEILAGTGDHLRSALDGEGQDLALLFSEGFTALERQGRTTGVLRWLNLQDTDKDAIDKLRELFPAHPPPLEIRLVAPTGLSTQDVLNYTSGARLTEAAESARAELLALGFSHPEIEANLVSHGARLECWETARRLTPGDRTTLRTLLDGRIQALKLAVEGPEPDYPHALQGADVLDTGIPHRGLLDLLAEPGRLCELMLKGHPHSALVIVDGASGARSRAMSRLDVMLWFAAGERHGREAVYAGIGLGADSVESWRADMRRRRRRAERLRQALHDNLPEEARRIYAEIVAELRQDESAHAALDETGQLALGGRLRPRDPVHAEALGRVAGGLPLEALGFTEFLSLGGLFLLVGASAEELEFSRALIENAILRFGGKPAGGESWRLLLPTKFRRAAPELIRHERGVESSNKATEEPFVTNLEPRRQLAARLARARALNERWAAFAAVPDRVAPFEECFRAAMSALGLGEEGVSETAFGQFMGQARNALMALAQELAEPAQRPTLLGRIGELCSGRRLELEVWEAMAGGYEAIGDFARLAQGVADQARSGDIGAEEQARRLDAIVKGAELFTILLAVDTVEAVLPDAADDPMPLWRTLADFFARTLNDHHYEYRPWLYSRGTGFAHWQGEALYERAMARHDWLYRYLRACCVRHTELGALPVQEQAALLGLVRDGETLVEAIGAEADGTAERAWRCYGQIRELAFIRNDGFPLPVVFPVFDPELIADRARINHVIATPVGRTHVSRLLREGPTLARELEAAGRPGANIIIGRKLELHHESGRPHPVARIRSGHIYLSEAAYRAALARYQPGANPVAVGPKGIRVAARFTRPVQAALVYPFHGDPVYTSGGLEQAGLPYTVQSLFHTWTTYDKAKYPDIFRDSGVELPAEIDWLADWSARADAAAVKSWIREGLPGAPWPGLAAFAGRYPRAVVKDAAESGGRNMRAFRLRDSSELAEAVDFIHRLSLKNNVAVQEVVHGTPEFWATEEFMEDYVRRNIVEWGQAVERRREPHSATYGSLRVILSTDNPEEPDPVRKWHLSHWITLNSRQLITNLGRGGILEQWLPKCIRPECRAGAMNRLAEAGRLAAEALSIYETRASEAYRAETGRKVGSDLLGVSYGRPRYLMLDFILAPVFEQPGRLVDIRPCYDADGARIGSVFILERDGREFPGEIVDWRAVLIEPNIGVGLWDRVALREEVHEWRRAETEGRAPDWDCIGREARVVLRDLNQAGEAYLRRLQETRGDACDA